MNSDHTLQTAAIFLITEVHEITFLVVNGISHTLLMVKLLESYDNYLPAR